MRIIDAHGVGKVVKIDVAGLFNGLVEIGCAMPAFLPVTKFASRTFDPIMPRAEDSLIRRDSSQLQSGQGKKWFDGRPCRIAAMDGAVIEWRLRVFLQCAIILVADAIDEQVGVEARFAGEHQDASRLDVDGNHCA